MYYKKALNEAIDLWSHDGEKAAPKPSATERVHYNQTPRKFKNMKVTVHKLDALIIRGLYSIESSTFNGIFEDLTNCHILLIEK